MKKNGFTLIEIIGAIVILGIIAIIAFATYTKNLKEFRENYYTRERKTVEKSAEEFFNDNRNYRPSKILNAQEVLISTLETKNYLNDVVDYNGDSCSQSSYVIVVKEGLDDYSYHACLICGKDGYDNTNEDVYCDKTWLDPTKVEYGIGEVDKKYVYKGTTRDDLKNQLELPISYVRKNNNGKVIAERRGTKEGNETLFPIDLDAVNTEVLGNYKVTYRYGEEEKQGDVEVYENESPTVTYKKENTVIKNIKGDEKVEKTDYTSGEWAQSIIVNLKSKKFVNDSISTSKFQWNVDGRWEDFCESDPCERKLTRELNQSIQFRLVDTNGNISLLTSPVQMKIDRTKPKCSLTIPTSKGSNDWYKTDVNVKFSEIIDQNLSNDNTIVSGIKNYNIQKSTESLTRVATINSITHSEDTSSVTYKGYVEDEAENFAMCEITFKRDATPPGCTNSGDSTSWTKDNRTIYYGCSDSLSQCSSGYSGGNTPFSTTTKTATIAAYTIKDNAGNEKTCPARTANVYVDKTAPSCTNSGDSTTWTSSNRTIYYGCSDSDSGCASGSSGGSKEFNTTTSTSSIAAYTIKDNAGNSTTCPARTANVYVDKVAPSCTNSGDSTSWTKDNRTIYYGCSDSDSGCASGSSGGSKEFNTTTSTSSIASYTIKDNAGNSTTCAARTANVYVDKSAPTCTVAKSNTGTPDGVTTTVTCSDSGIGCDASTSSSGDTGLTDGTYTYKVYDKLGNEGSCSVTVTKQRQQRTRSCTAGNTCKNSGCGTESYTYTGTCKGTLYCYYPNQGGAESCGHTSVPSGYTSTGSYQGEYSCEKTGTRYKTCSKISVCGCKTWGSWTAWTNVSSCSIGISQDNSTDTSCRSVYN